MVVSMVHYCINGALTNSQAPDDWNGRVLLHCLGHLVETSSKL
jgi:hypothetical protein